MIRRFENWGIDHLDFMVALALVVSIVALIVAVVVAVAT